MKKNKVVWVSLLIVLAIFLGFYRDRLFIPINEAIKRGLQVGMIKWFLTLGFTVAYWLLTIALVRVIFQSKRYVLIGVGAYLFILLIALLVSTFGYFFSSFQEVYPLVRSIMGIAQSPIIAMVLIVWFYLDTSQ
jgi:hypothetical protein